MKKRRLIISLFLIAAVALIGIGYAAISHGLKVSTDITPVVSDSNLKVKFAAAETGLYIHEGSDEGVTITAESNVLSTHGNLEATLRVSGLSSAGDKVVCYIMIVNESDDSETLNAILSTPTIKLTSPKSLDEVESTFDGDHFKINTSFVTAKSLDDGAAVKVDSSIAVKDLATADGYEAGSLKGTEALVETKTSTAVGQAVYLRIEIAVDLTFTDAEDVETHVFHISTTATSTDKTKTTWN